MANQLPGNELKSNLTYRNYIICYLSGNMKFSSSDALRGNQPLDAQRYYDGDTANTCHGPSWYVYFDAERRLGHSHASPTPTGREMPGLN